MDPARINRIEREIQRLRDGLAQRPVIVPAGGSSTTFRTLAIIGGNTLVSGQDGVAYSGSTIASVPSAYDPTIDTTFIDGIGRAVLYENGVAAAAYVLVVNDGSGGAIDFDLLGDGDVAMAGATKTIAISGGGGATVTVYTMTFI